MRTVQERRRETLETTGRFEVGCGFEDEEEDEDEDDGSGVPNRIPHAALCESLES